MIIGICGGTGSGKTTIARSIAETVGRDRVVSPALRAYAAMATSADTGAVRDVNAVERAVAAAAEARDASLT